MKILKTIRAVLWSFLGIRRRSGLESDTFNVSPFYFIGVGIGMCILFVIGLKFFVQWIVTTA